MGYLRFFIGILINSKKDLSIGIANQRNYSNCSYLQLHMDLKMLGFCTSC